jgi:transcriptional regulator with XRE-family HTH domain
VRSQRSTASFCTALGDAIRAERTRLGWSQEDLAERAHLNRSYTTDLENGRRTPNLDTLLRVAKALGMKPSKLLAAGEARLARPG